MPGERARPARPTRRSSLRALKHPSFALYFVGNLLSNCGTWFQNIALALLVFRLTQSTFWVGVVNFAQFIGVVLLAPWAGSAADRFNRRRLIVVTQVGAMAVSALLAWLIAINRGALPVVLTLALLLGATTAFSTPAQQAIIPALVPRDDLSAAIAMNSVTFNLARAVGPVAGAFVVARLGIAWAIAVNAGSYLIFAAAILIIHIEVRQERAVGRVKLRESVKMLGRDPTLAILLGVVAVVSLTMDPVSTLTPAIATQFFHRPDTYAGILIGAFGTGAVIGSVVPLHDTDAPGKRIASMLTLLAVGMISFAIFAGSPAALALLAAGGFGYLIGQTTATTQLQLRVSDRERGRVMALWSVAFLGTRPIAALIDGGLSSWIGPRPTIVVLAVPSLVAAALVLSVHARRQPDVRP
jgi:MFS family permease